MTKINITQTESHVRAFYNTVTDDHSALIQLSFMRNHCKQAFDQLCRTDLKCASIAVRRGWVKDDDPQRGWGDRQAVAKTLARAPGDKAVIAAIRAALTRYAPEHLDLVGGPSAQ